MLIEIQELLDAYPIAEVTGVIHVGAHLAEEAERYDALGVPVWWVEANPAVQEQVRDNIQKYPQQRLIQALVAAFDGEMLPFNVTNYDGMSSSIFPFGEHTKHSPDTVYVDRLVMPSVTLDTLVAEHDIKANLLNLDIQGAELLALQGAAGLIKELDYIYTEVSTGPTYLGGALMPQIDEHLSDFQRVETNLGMHDSTHGDAFYIRVRNG